jgi:hypothetical protein
MPKDTVKTQYSRPECYGGERAGSIVFPLVFDVLANTAMEEIWHMLI